MFLPFSRFAELARPVLAAHDKVKRIGIYNEYEDLNGGNTLFETCHTLFTGDFEDEELDFIPQARRLEREAQTLIDGINYEADLEIRTENVQFDAFRDEIRCKIEGGIIPDRIIRWHDTDEITRANAEEVFRLDFYLDTPPSGHEMLAMNRLDTTLTAFLESGDGDSTMSKIVSLCEENAFSLDPSDMPGAARVVSSCQQVSLIGGRSTHIRRIDIVLPRGELYFFSEA